MRGTSVTPVQSDARHQAHKCCGAKARPITCPLGIGEFPSSGQCCLQGTAGGRSPAWLWRGWLCPQAALCAVLVHPSQRAEVLLL